MITKVFFSCWLMLMVFCVSAQDKDFFAEPVAYLGTVVDNQGVVDHRFEFVNHTSDSLQVENVTASCGCTSTDWTVLPVEPGGSGYVAVQFDPNNRPGPFEKFITVSFRDQPHSTQLAIKGFVKPASASIEEEFPWEIGALRMKQSHLDLGTIASKSLFSKSFEIYNQGNQILIFSDDMEGPDHITVTYEPYTLKPRSTGKMWVHYDVGAKKDLGYFSENISVFTYESSDNRKDFTVTATLLDIPQSVTPESPRIQFDRTEIDFGRVQQGDTINGTFELRNIGQSTLHLKKIFGNCNCIKVNANTNQVHAGELAQISVRFITDERIGNQEKTVTIFSDDPMLPVAILKLKGRLLGSRN